MGKNIRKMNAARVCFGISRIGYTPSNAVCDIIDNAVSAHAKNIYVDIKRKNNRYNDNKKNNVEQYLIIDDGDGMSAEKIGEALDLGSGDFEYAQDSLSKFGLGLKSASFAQGRRLEVISGDGTGFHKEYVDLDEIEEEYFSVSEELSEEDIELVEKYFSAEKKGTIIRITKISNNNHPSIKSILKDLKEKIGVIYYYFLKKELHIFLCGEEIEAFDPLFVEEASSNNLDENTWDGKDVRWILRPTTLMLDSEAEINGDIEITMLPHPQVRKSEGISDASIREKYKISASNYGFYVYRNKRLINWANRFDGIIPQDVDYYAFRGRINIQSDADDAFNIDVSKSKIILSEESRNGLDDFITEYKRKCKKAWTNAWKKYKEQISEDANDISNGISNEVGDFLDSTSCNDDRQEFIEEVEKREAEILSESHEKEINETISRLNEEQGILKNADELTDEDITETMKGKATVDAISKIFKVQLLADNQLWEPYKDAELKECVRISKSHRFSKLMYENNSDNKDMQVLFELLLYIEALAEFEIRKTFHEVNHELVASILEEYRLAVSERLVRLCRKEENNLPPYYGER